MPHDEITRVLLAHFDATKRQMPWRGTSDPYAIWVSEVMLQQTRVDTVIPYWERWLERFPTVDVLAEAELDEVLKEWEGLGYYSRARNLHRAARMVRECFNGRVPDRPDALRELPGVGPYTAGAVASIAFDVATPAVDGNVRRVLSRLYDLEAPTPATLRDLAADLVPTDRPGDFNQALMELGATVCTPRSPACDACPLAPWCEARRLGVQELRPLPKEGKPVPEEVVRTAVIVRADGAVLLARRPEDGLLGGLWELPGDDGGWPAEVATLMDAGEPGGELDPVIHTFSHKRIRYRPFVVWVSGSVKGAADPGVGAAWVGLDRLDGYALPVAQQKIAAAARALIR
ncbi:MAG: A/G-specific adenine glycosylase [Longimicrobiales bacterium]